MAERREALGATTLTGEKLTEMDFTGYRSAVGHLVGGVGFRRSIRRSFRGHVEVREFGTVEMARIESSEVEITRSHDLIQSDRKAGFFIPFVIAGQGSIEQAGRTCALGSDQFTLVDMTHPHRARFGEPTTRLLACFPVEEFVRRDCRADGLAGRAIRADSGIGRLARRFILDLFQTGSALSPEARRQTVEMAVDLLVLALRETIESERLEGVASGPLSDRRLIEAEAVIRANLADPMLSPIRIAERCGISVRYLHRLFEQTGHTVAQRIRTERLRKCYRDLRDPRLRHKTIVDIAFGWGFNDASHFSRSFHAEFGLTPRAARHGTIDQPVDGH